MKCILPAVNLKNFGKAIHCLAKIGFEVYIEVLGNGIELKTVNSSRSSYFCFHFYKSNFSYYDQSWNPTSDRGGGDASTSSDDECFRCKIQMKTILQVFKSLNSIEKSVEQCAIHLDEEESRLIFQLKCRHAITKTHHIHYQDCDSLQAKFAKDLCPNSLKCEYKLLMDAAFNFHSSLEEISLSVTPCQVLLRSVPGDDDQITHSMKTEMQLSPDEFLDFQVGVDTEVTFCLKDIRAILAFCEVASCPVQLSFESGGKPLIVSCEEERLFKANFVLATISAQFPTVAPDLPQTTMTSHRICNSTTMMSKKSNSTTTANRTKKRPATTNNNGHHPRHPSQVEPTPQSQEYGSVLDAFYQPSEFNYSRIPQEPRLVLAEDSDYSTDDES